MSCMLKNLLTLLNLEKLRKDSFRGQSEDLGLRRCFHGGGSWVRPCALQKRPSRSGWYIRFTATFRPGDSKKPIIYDVETLRDGNSFSARRVAAIQNGKPIFYMTASFRAPEAGFRTSKTMPSAPAPDGLPSETQIAQSLAHLPASA